MKSLVLAGCAALTLAGCSSPSEQDPGAPIRREPGLWRTDMQLVKIDVPGAPKQVLDSMQAMAAELSGVEVYLTAEESAKEDFGTAFAKAPGDQGQCNYTKKDVAGGKLDIVMECTLPGAKKPTTIAMQGTITPRRVEMHQTSTGELQGFPLSIEMKATNIRTGDCKA